MKFVHARGLTAAKEIRVGTLGGTIVPRLEPDGEVTVDMGPPRFSDPFPERISIKDESVEVAILSMGNPHAVQVVPDVEKAPGGPIHQHQFVDRQCVDAVRKQLEAHLAADAMGACNRGKGDACRHD